ncbi:thioesterase II family protein [Siccirubricoccus phaeus]|uniref:thioesterase II family protein n=1 Tax=Siccirubricoccus phaeus TaxID=2595053 RepID=UPI0011F3316A|nr:alpha/beta fold hydrolase [Siccirubricoccus phaeus]
MSADPWFPYAPEAAETLLVCFPFAGGSAAFYRPWMAPARALGLALLPVELPGRGFRRQEAPLRTAGALMAALGPALRRRLDRPFLLFGHSLGALLAFEAARHLRRRYALLPAALAVSGRHPPHLGRDPTGFRHALPPPEFLQALQGLNGTAPELLTHPEFMALAEPALRADFAMTELYAYAPDAPLDCPLLALTGEADPEVSVQEMAGWARHGAAGFRLVTRPGDHFYLRDQAAEVLAQLRLAALRPVPLQPAPA